MSSALGRVTTTAYAQMIPRIIASVPKYRQLAQEKGYDFAMATVVRDQEAAIKGGRRQGMLLADIPDRTSRTSFTTWQEQSADHSLRKLEMMGQMMSLMGAYSYVDAFPAQSVVAWIGARFQNQRGSSRTVDVGGLSQAVVEAHPQPTTLLINALHLSAYAPDPSDGHLRSVTNSTSGGTTAVIEAHNLLDERLARTLRGPYVNTNQGILSMHDLGRTGRRQESIDFVTAQWSSWRGAMIAALKAFIVAASSKQSLSEKDAALLAVMLTIAKSELVITTETVPATMVPASQRMTIELLEESVASGIVNGTTPSTQTIVSTPKNDSSE